MEPRRVVLWLAEWGRVALWLTPVLTRRAAVALRSRLLHLATAPQPTPEQGPTAKRPAAQRPAANRPAAKQMTAK